MTRTTSRCPTAEQWSALSRQLARRPLQMHPGTTRNARPLHAPGTADDNVPNPPHAPPAGSARRAHRQRPAPGQGRAPARAARALPRLPSTPAVGRRPARGLGITLPWPRRFRRIPATRPPTTRRTSAPSGVNGCFRRTGAPPPQRRGSRGAQMRDEAGRELVTRSCWSPFHKTGSRPSQLASVPALCLAPWSIGELYALCTRFRGAAAPGTHATGAKVSREGAGVEGSDSVSCTRPGPPGQLSQHRVARWL